MGKAAFIKRPVISFVKTVVVFICFFAGTLALFFFGVMMNQQETLRGPGIQMIVLSEADEDESPDPKDLLYNAEESWNLEKVAPLSPVDGVMR